MALGATWLVVVGVDGRVLAVERGAPAAWVGAVLHELPGIPAPVREASRTALDAARGVRTELSIVRVGSDELGATLEIAVVPAVGLHRGAVDPRVLVAHAIAGLERQARALDVSLTVTVDPDVPREILVDPEKLGFCVAALVGNAVRYVRRGTRQMPGGSVSVTARWAPPETLVLAVEDDGPGIPAAVLERLFQRAPGASLAAGLGLSVVRDVVTAHGGAIDVASSTEEGDSRTTVTLRLPVLGSLPTSARSST